MILEKCYGHPSFFLPHKIILPLLLFLGFGLNALNAQHLIEGKWKDDKGGGIIKIYEQDGLYYGQLVEALDEEENQKIKEKEILILHGFKQQSDQEFCCGKIFQLRARRKVVGSLFLEDQNTLKITGSFMGFKRKRIWKRI